MLIHQQHPGATRVASFSLWKDKFNRHVKKGEKGLSIYAPIIKKESEKKMMEKLDPATNAPIIGEDGEVVMEEMTKLESGPRFKLVHVFDIGQTYGEPLPELIEDLTNNVEHFDALMEALKAVSPLPIEFEKMRQSQDGYCHYGEKIGIREGMSEAQTIAAVIHEITHARLHDKNKLPKNAEPKTKKVKEVEAESVAYVVAQRFGIDTAPNSFGYLAEYGSRDMSELQASLDTIRKESSNLIHAIEDKFIVLSKERGIGLYAKETEQAAPAPEKAKANTTPHKNYQKLAELFPQIASGEYDYMRLEAGEGFMPLSVEWISDKRLSIMQTYKQNGGLMYDPKITFEVDHEAKTVNVVELQQSDPPIYQVIDEDGIGHSIDGDGNERMIKSLQGQINTFVTQWFDNIGDQKYMPVSATLNDEGYTDPTVSFNSDKKPFNFALMYEKDGTMIFNNLDKSKEHQYGLAKVAYVDSYRNVTIFEKNLPPDAVQFIENVELLHEKPKKEYSLGYGFAGNGITVWNSAETKDGDYVTVAHIQRDRTVTYYDKGMPNEIKADIEHTAQTIDDEALEPLAAQKQDKTEPAYSMPDPSISFEERNAYGYGYEEMLPLTTERALELFDTDHPIFMLYANNKEDMVLERDDIIKFGGNGIFGITQEDWERSPLYSEQSAAVKDSDVAAKQSAFSQFQPATTSALQHNQALADIHERVNQGESVALTDIMEAVKAKKVDIKPEKPSVLEALKTNEQKSKEQFGQKAEPGKDAPKVKKEAEVL
jgi:hypothetical protein